MAAQSAAVLNVAEDHLDWYASMADYAADKGRIYDGVERACVYNVADPVTEELVREADVVEGARAIGFTLGMPGGRHARRGRRRAGRPRLRRAAPATPPPSSARSPTWRPRRRTSSPTRWPPPPWPAPTASPPVAVRDGLRGFRPDGHRIAEVATVDEVTYVDDSKATNPHAARVLAAAPTSTWCGSPAAWPRAPPSTTSWPRWRGRLRGVVLLGATAR